MMTEAPVTGSAGKSDPEKSAVRTASVWTLLAIIIATGALLRLKGVDAVRQPGPDAFHYARQAEIVLIHGTAGLRVEADRFRYGSSMWGVPPPWRAGFLYAAAGWMQMTGERGPLSVAHFAAWTDVLAMILLGLLAWRTSALMQAGAWQTIAAVALYAVSPPVLQMARHGWEEPFLGCAGIGMLLVATLAIDKAEWWWPALLGLLAGFSLSIKETALIEGAVIGAVAGLALAHKKAWNRFGSLCGAFMLSTLICGWWLADIAGGAAQLIGLLESNVARASTIPYAVVYQSGGLFRWLYTIWQCDPVLLTLGAIGMFTSLRKQRQPPMIWASGIAFLFLALPFTGTNLLNVRFANAAIAPVCLLAAHALFRLQCALTEIVPPRMARVAFLAGTCYLAAVVALDVNWYQTVFEKPDLQDLSAGMIAGLER